MHYLASYLLCWTALSYTDILKVLRTHSVVSMENFSKVWIHSNYERLVEFMWQILADFDKFALK